MELDKFDVQDIFYGRKDVHLGANIEIYYVLCYYIMHLNGR